MAKIERVNILGVGVSAINMAQALSIVESWIADGRREYICVTNTFSVMECRRDPHLRAIFNQAGLVTPDGMPLVWLSRLAGYRHVGRVYGPDLMLALCERATFTGYRHYFYGSAPDVLDALVCALKRQFPGLIVAGQFSPPFRELNLDEEQEIMQAINAARPDIVWVSLGTNQQEHWMATHQGRLRAGALIGVGAAFDFLSGAKPQAPRWMRNNGLEWLFRLATEPRRLWRRYLISAPLFGALVVLQWLRLRAFPTDR